MAFADRSWPVDQDVQEISRFSCMLFLSVRGFLDYAGPSKPLAISVVAVLPSSLPERSRRPVPSAFRSSIARPTDTSVYASSDTSRYRLQDSRPGWIRYSPFPWGSFIPYNMPVYPGALRVADNTPRTRCANLLFRCACHFVPAFSQMRLAV